MYYFIVNTKSKTGRSEKIWQKIKKELHTRGVEYEAFLTSYSGHAGKLARALCEEKQAPLDIVVLGGDGTVNEVLNGITDFKKVRLGFISTGSGNDFGRGLKLPKDPIEGLHRILNAKETRSIDLGHVRSNLDTEGKYFAISSGIGLDAAVCYAANHTGVKKFLNHFGLGKLTYLFLTLREIFFEQRTEISVTLSDRTGNTTDLEFPNMIFTAAMNLSAEGGGIRMAPRARVDDGEFSLCCFYGYGRLATLFLFPLLIIGKQEIVKEYRIIPFENCSIRMRKPVTLHYDGEYGGAVSEVTFVCKKGQLRLLS